MKKIQSFSSERSRQIVWGSVALILSFSGGYFVAFAGVEGVVRLIQFIVLIGATLLILRRPYWGLVFIVASLPLLDILPSIPFASSVVSLLGIVTLGAHLLSRTTHREKSFHWSASLVWGCLLVFWIIVSNPSASLLPGTDDRNWAFTFIQLWLLAWLAAQMLDTPSKHRTLIWVFSIAVLLSAVYALTQGNIGQSLKLSDRAEGLAGGANSAARYFVVGLVFIVYLRATTKKSVVSFFLLLGLGLVIIATFYTVSRTGLLLLFSAIGLSAIQRFAKYQIQAVIGFVMAFLIIWLFADNILTIIGTISSSIREGTDTVGLRYNLWRAGWRMWLDHPVHGVGIGQFVERLASYGSDLLEPRRLRLGAHNMYVQVLAETGLVGFFLFLAMLISTIREIWTLRNLSDPSIITLAQTWFIVFVIMLLGGLTKHDHYDKLIWIMVGIGIGLQDRKNGFDENR
ncbi:MAG: O-antigen ligase family protein [Anaerolineales bacterium]|nr:O-antigen ligase family protein [Anaerolineales bacterium]